MHNNNTSLLSISAIINKNIAVLFVQDKALFISMLHKITVVGYSMPRPDGLLYISDSQVVISVEFSGNTNTVGELIATVGSAIDTDTNSVSSDDGSSGASNRSGAISPQTCTESMAVQSRLASDECSGSENTVSSGVLELHLCDGDTESNCDNATHGLNARGKAE